MIIRRALIPLAWLNVVLHVVALALASWAIRAGCPLVPVADRIKYLAGAPVGWTLAWACWMACALALIAFLAVLTHRLRERAPWASVALMIAVAGAGFDLFCDSVYILVFPQLAATQHETLFLAVEKMVGIGSLVIANGAYSIAVLLLNAWAVGRGEWGEKMGHTHHASRLTHWTFVTGNLSGGFGLLLAAAGFTGVPWHAEWATPPTIGFFCVWAVLIAKNSGQWSVASGQ